MNVSNATWLSFDPVTRTMMLKIENPPVVAPSGHRTKEGYTFPNLVLLMKNQPLNQRIDLTTQFYVNYGLANQRELPTRILPLKFNPIPFTQSGSMGRYKDNLPDNYNGTHPINYNMLRGEYTIVGDRLYDRMYDQTENGLFYISKIANSNNGSGPENKENGRMIEVFRVSDYLYTSIAGTDHGVQNDANDRRTYYKSFTIGEVVRHGAEFFDLPRMQQIIADTITQINSTPNKLYGVKLDGSKVLLKNNLQYQEKFEVNDVAQEYVQLELEFEQPIRLNNSAINFYTQTFPTPSEMQKFRDKVHTTKQTYHGKFGMEFRYYNGKDNTYGRNTYTVGVGNLGFTSIEPISPFGEFQAFRPQRTVNFRNNNLTIDAQETDIRFRSLYGQWGPLANRELTGAKLIELLPQGFNYIRHEALLRNGVLIPAPQIINNFKDTGRTAVIYDLPPFVPSETSKRDLRVKTYLSVDKETKTGENILDSFIVYPQNDIIKPNVRTLFDPSYIDELDLDNDGDTSEIFMKSRSVINYIAPLEHYVVYY